ncbi:hypothetical protein V8D89_011397 [Ganoderma adspersum]
MDEDLRPTPPPEPEDVLPRSQEYLRNAPAHVRHFSGHAGEPTLRPEILVSGYKEYTSKVSDSANNPYAPFNSRLDWEIARWGKLHGPSSTSLTELLQIEGVTEALGLSFTSVKQLNAIVDEKIPLKCPVFVRHQVSAQEHARYLVFIPECHYADEDHTIHLYHDLHTGKWWWQMQKAIEEETPGAAIIPIIISSDKTQITLFHNKSTFPSIHESHDLDTILDALRHPQAADFTQRCRDLNVKLIQHPFWIDLPYTNIYQSITPDVLHQLYQGVFKHLLSWLKDTCGAAEIDARASRLPPNHGVHVFWKGITKLARVSGAEHKQISRFLLGLVVDIPLPDPDDRTLTTHLVRATRSLLEFLNMVQYPIHSDDSLASLNAALASFHAMRDIFVDLGIWSGFCIPKLHYLLLRFLR